MVSPEALYQTPNALARHYTRFRVSERLLLTGHSHQAWPDRGFAGQQRAWLDAAELVDHKWRRAFEVADRVRAGFGRLLDNRGGSITLGANTHELLIRWLSALPLQDRPQLVTTDREFHTIRFQLDRLAQTGIAVVRVAAHPAATVAQRLIAATGKRTAAVLVSAVFYETAHIVPGLGDVMTACRKHGAELLVDAYHAIDAVPFPLGEQRLDDAFVVGGGYKYCQLGEGNCFLRAPPDCTLQPVVQGWFGELAAVHPAAGGLFPGATYDPTSHYRAAEVFEFFDEHGLTPALLREVSRHQVGQLARRFDQLDADPRVIRRDRTVPLEGIAGFLALRTPHAQALTERLHERGVQVDYRGDVLRLGPAPYLSDSQLETAIDLLGDALRGLR
ncbi:MAG: kynureninase [Gemmatimonadales bacterium]